MNSGTAQGAYGNGDNGVECGNSTRFGDVDEAFPRFCVFDFGFLLSFVLREDGFELTFVFRNEVLP